MPSEPPSIVRLWDLTAKKPTAWAVLKSGGVLLSSAFSADGNTLAWITHSYKRLLDLRSIKPEERNVNVSELQSTALDKLATTVAFSPDGKMLAWGNREGVVEIRELGGIMSKIRAKFHAHKSAVRSLTFSQNGTMLASTSPDGVRLWDRNGKRIRKRTDLQVKLTVPVSVAFLSDGTVQVAAIGSDRKTLRLWNLDGNQAEERTAGNKLRRLIEFSSDGKTLAVCSEDGSVEFWDLQGPQPTRRAEIEGPKQTVLAMVFAADDTLKVASTIYGKGILQVWDLAAGKHPQLVATLQGYRGHVSFATGSKEFGLGRLGLHGEPVEPIWQTPFASCRAQKSRH
jgi:WD40 repeat protein